MTTMTMRNLRGHVTHALSRVASCTAMGVALLAPTSLFADAPINAFIIGAYKPAGWINHDEGVPGADAYFTSSDVDMLSAMGINLVVWTTELEDFDPAEAPTSSQYDEETIASLFGGPEDTGGGLVVRWPAEGISDSMAYPTGRNLITFAGAWRYPMYPWERHRLGGQADSLSTKWARQDYVDGFWGYFVGHEAYPNWDTDPYTEGIYDALTYPNLGTVIDSIRKYDPDRRIYVTGDAGNQGTWIIQEQNEFIDTFSRPYSESPANVFANERYILWCDSDEEEGTDASVQAQLDGLAYSLGRSRDMVVAARESLNPPREAEWFHTINVNDEYWNADIDPCTCWSNGESPHYRKPSRAEIKVQAYMALARGATGIMYYAYTSNPDVVDFSTGSERWYHGIVRFMTGEEPRPKYAMADTLASINDTLAVIGDSLKTIVLRDSSAFRRNFTASSVPTECVIEDITSGSGGDPGRVEIGLFRDARVAHADYILVVNRDDILEGDTPQTIDIILDVSELEGAPPEQGVYSIENAVTGESLKYEAGNGEILIDDLTMMPGDGVLLRVTESGWSGELTGNVIWSGTVDVVGDVTVPADRTLTISSGTVVEFAATSDDQSAGYNPNACELLVKGTLVAEGVTFRSAESELDWSGIVMMGAGSPTATTESDVRNCTIQDAVFGTLMWVSNWTLGSTNEGTVDVAEENHYLDCMYGVIVMNGGGAYGASGNELRNLHIEGSTYGIVLSGVHNTLVEQVLVHDLNIGGRGVWIPNGSSGVKVRNVTVADAIDAQGIGILWESGSSGEVNSSLAKNLGGGGVRSNGGGSVDVLYYLGYHTNTLGNELDGIDPSDVKAIWSVPRVDGGYALQLDSPALDMGDPDPNLFEPPPINSRRDIGRFGGTNQAGTATGSVLLESYFEDGDATGWEPLAATSGSWAGNVAHGEYRVIDVAGQSLAHETVAASNYTIETRMRLNGLWGTVVLGQADEWDQWRLDLMAAEDEVRLHTPMAWYTADHTIHTDTWHDVRVEVRGDTADTYIDGIHLHDGVSLGGLTMDGSVGIGNYGSMREARFDHVVVINGGGTAGGSAASTDYHLGFNLDFRHEVDVGSVTTGGTDKYTVEAWVRPSATATSGTHEIVGQHGGASDARGTLDLDNGKARFLLTTSGLTTLTSISSVPSGVWTHLAAVYDGSHMRLYINGVEDIATPKSGSITTTAAYRGTRLGGYAGSATGPIWFDGEIDEVRIWSVARSAPQIADNRSAEISGQSGLLGYWRLDDKPGLRALDHSGNGNTGDLTAYGGPYYPAWIEGGFDSSAQPPPAAHSLSFDRTNRQEVYVGSVTTSGNTYSVEAWAKPTDTGGYREIVGNHGDGSNCRGTLDIGYGTVRFFVTTSQLQIAYSSAPIPTGVWTHVAGVYNGSYLQVYINGSPSGSPVAQSGNITTASNRGTLIGGYSGTCSCCDCWFDGLIDEVRIWNTARTQSQLAGNKDAEIPAPQSGLIGYWRLNDGIGTSAADSSGFGNTGVLRNYDGQGRPIWVADHFASTKLVAAAGVPRVFALLPNQPQPLQSGNGAAVRDPGGTAGAAGRLQPARAASRDSGERRTGGGIPSGPLGRPGRERSAAGLGGVPIPAFGSQWYRLPQADLAALDVSVTWRKG